MGILVCIPTRPEIVHCTIFVFEIPMVWKFANCSTSTVQKYMGPNENILGEVDRYQKQGNEQLVELDQFS